MRAARIGWFLVLLAVIGGYAFGRYRKAASERAAFELREEAALPRVNARSRAVKISTYSPQELDLPSDPRYTNSLPRISE